MRLAPLLWAVLLMSGPPSTGFTHSGGLNAQGCHGGSRPYHCHRAASAFVNTQARGTSGDMNCSDFTSWQQAQRFYLAAGADDPHGLDRDNDGIACESLQ